MSQRPPDVNALPELTLRGMILGALITVVFTASNVYLGLKVGLTFASSIPAAVISMAVLRSWRGANILENNMVQTQASAAGALSAIIFILPGLLMVGFWEGFPFWQTAAICAIGGILGVLYTIPLRRVMVVQSSLPYPEGLAAAEILRVGGGTEPASQDAPADGRAPGLRDIVIGAIAAAAFSLFSGGFRLLAESISLWLTAGRVAFQLSTGFSLALAGVGYLVGIVGGIAILVGVIIAWGVAVPILMLDTPLADGQSLSALATQVWSDDVRFIGAGTIGIAAIWTLITLFRPMVQGIMASLTAPRLGPESSVARTERDMPGRWIVALVVVLLIALIAVFANLLGNAAPGLSGVPFWSLVFGCVLFAFLFSFLIAAACGYMAGLVGSSSSPISGIGILAVILVSLMILTIISLQGGTAGSAGGMLAIALTLFTTSVVVATASISNDNLQDLKTGYLLGATPWRQQVALIIGCAVGALVIPPVLELLYNAYGFAGALPRAEMDPHQALGAPQATLMTALARGIFAHDLNWTMIVTGLILGAALIAVDELLRHRGSRARLPVLAVGLGIYLPPSIEMPIVIGAVVGWLISRRLARQAAARGEKFTTFAARPLRRGVLLASGLIVGESLMGVLMAGVIGTTGRDAPLALVGEGFAGIAQWLGLIVFIAACVGFYRYTLGRAER